MTDDMSSGGIDGPSSDTEALRLTRKESRAVLERKFEVLEDIDQKAMHTVRTAIVMLGVVVSAAGISGTDGLTSFGLFPALLVVAGTFSLLLSFIGGVVIYAVSGVPDGVSRAHQKDVLERNFKESEWLYVLILSYVEWIDGVARTNQRNAKYLTAIQILLAIGLFLLVLAVVLSGVTN